MCQSASVLPLEHRFVSELDLFGRQPSGGKLRRTKSAIKRKSYWERVPPISSPGKQAYRWQCLTGSSDCTLIRHAPARHETVPGPGPVSHIAGLCRRQSSPGKRLSGYRETRGSCTSLTSHCQRCNPDSGFRGSQLVLLPPEWDLRSISDAPSHRLVST